jgi:hypothetical protein
MKKIRNAKDPVTRRERTIPAAGGLVVCQLEKVGWLHSAGFDSAEGQRLALLPSTTARYESKPAKTEMSFPSTLSWDSIAGLLRSRRKLMTEMRLSLPNCIQLTNHYEEAGGKPRYGSLAPLPSPRPRRTRPGAWTSGGCRAGPKSDSGRPGFSPRPGASPSFHPLPAGILSRGTDNP